MAECKVERFSLKELSDALTKGTYGNIKIVVPMFQRGKRWDKNADKESKFIDSLKRNFPVGTLLFYKTVEDGKEIYTLIDGLQRSTTIKKYLTNPTRYFNLSQLSYDAVHDLYDLVCTDEAQKRIVDDCILEYVRGLKNFGEFNMIKLITKLKDSLNLQNIAYDKVDELLKDSIDSLKREYDNLCKIEIPALIYTGPEDTLPEIFDRVNSQGVALTDYEIFVASWPKDRFKVENENIIAENIKKYNYLGSGEYELQGYNETEFKNNKLLNAFEYVFGLSKYLCNKYDSLKFNMNLEADIANPVGFELLNACFFSSHKTLKDVYKIVLSYKNNLDKLEKALETCVKFIEGCISPITRFKSNTHGDNGKIFHSQLQILSLVSCTFRLRYNLDDLTEKNDWQEMKRTLEKNVIQYYVLDIITKYWHEGGGKIYTANSELRYLKPIHEKIIANALDTYSDNIMLRHESKQVKGVSEPDYVILNVIYMNTFTARDQLSNQKFDVEHIATKKQMISYIKDTKSDGLPISHIANLCYLPQEANRSKHDKNFYQDQNYLNLSGLTLEEIETKYSFTKKSDLEWMDITYRENDDEILKDYYIGFLSSRYKLLKKKFLQSLGFTVEEEVTEQVEKAYYGDFDENYFISHKIGEIMRACFSTISSYELLNEEDIENLQNEEYSKNNLGCNYPVLVDHEDKTIDYNGKKRYYSEPIMFNRRTYYLCNDWYDEDRELVIPWLKSKLEKGNSEEEFIHFL